MHDLARLYAGKRAREHAQADGSENAVQRLHGYCADLLFAAEAWLRSSLTSRPVRPGPFGSRMDAVAWLDDEYRMLVALVAAASASQRWADAYELAAHLEGYQEFRHLIADGITVATQALAAARHLGRARECAATMRLGNACRGAWRHEEAVDHLKRALELAPANDPAGEASIRHNLGLAYLRLGQFAEAESCHRFDLEVCQAAVKPELARRLSQDGGAWPGAADMMKLRAWQVSFLASSANGAADAVELGNVVLDDCQRLLGESHQETWRARNNLAGANGCWAPAIRARWRHATGSGSSALGRGTSRRRSDSWRSLPKDAGALASQPLAWRELWMSSLSCTRNRD
jgi:tetratricopeptide (TPR) repeat protein